MLNIILTDAELELVPENIAGHPAVRKNAEKRKKKPTRTILDSCLHHQALKALPDGSRRGRPDITHFFLLLCLDSIANTRGCLRVWLHTRNNEVVCVSPETRIPRSASRFFGLMEQLLCEGSVPDSQKPLMHITEGGLRELLDGLPGKKIALSQHGTHKSPEKIFDSEENITLLIGGFADGDYISPVGDLVDEVISIYPGELKVWTVASAMLSTYETKNNMLG